MYALVADCVSKAFGERSVLTSASLRAKTGEVRVIFGRNGEGKSTLLKIAVGWLQPDSGVVRVGDLQGVVAAMRALRLVDDRLGAMPGFDDRRTTLLEQQRLAAFLQAYRDDQVT